MMLIALHCHMSKLFIPSNFATANLVFVTLDLDDIENFKNSPGVDYGANEPEVAPPYVVV